MATGFLPMEQAAFASTGTGSLDDPLIVTTPQELSSALDNANYEHIKLGADLDLATAVIGAWGNRIFVTEKDKIVDLNGFQLTHWGLVIRFYNSTGATPTYGSLTIKDSSPAGTGKIRTGMGAGINANTFSGAEGANVTHKLIIDDVDFVFSGDKCSVLGIANTKSPSHHLDVQIKNVNVSVYDNTADCYMSFVDANENEKNNITIDIQNSKIESAKTQNSVQKINAAEGLTSADLSYFIKNTSTVKIDGVEQSATANRKTLGKKIEVITVNGGADAINLSTYDKTNGTSITNRPIGWYSLDGKRLAGEPTTKGVYINRGKKVVK